MGIARPADTAVPVPHSPRPLQTKHSRSRVEAGASAGRNHGIPNPFYPAFSWVPRFQFQEVWAAAAPAPAPVSGARREPARVGRSSGTWLEVRMRAARPGLLAGVGAPARMRGSDGGAHARQ